MKNKEFNMKLLSTYLILIFISIVINYIIDPLDVFHCNNILNKERPAKDKNHRISVIPGFKLYKDKVSAVWIGSSRTRMGSNEVYESDLLKNGGGKKIKLLTLNDCTISEAVTMVKNAILIHPEIKTIYYGLDYVSMKQAVIENTEEFKHINKTTLEKNEILPLILSLNSLQYSFSTILKNIKHKKTNKKEIYGNENYNNPKIKERFRKVIEEYYKKHYNNYSLDKRKINELNELKNYLEARGIKFVFFITQMHITERILLNNTSDINEFYNFKEELSKIQPYWDFAVVDKYTCEEIKPDMRYFRDPVHAQPPLRKKITNQLFQNSEDYGFYVTKDNIKQHNNDDYKNFLNFINNNKQLTLQVQEWSK